MIQLDLYTVSFIILFLMTIIQYFKVAFSDPGYLTQSFESID